MDQFLRALGSEYVGLVFIGLEVENSYGSHLQTNSRGRKANSQI
jgi:hypothetical protein